VLKIGVWEAGKFIGCVLFSRGNARHIGKPYGLAQTEVCELTRVALTTHTSPVSRIVAQALRMLHRSDGGLRLVVSFADPEHDHAGTIYQAGGWLYEGLNSGDTAYFDAAGKRHHSRMVSSTGVSRVYGKLRRVPLRADCTAVRLLPKHKYLMPLDDAMRAQIEPLRKPYPKRPKQATTSVQEARGGAAPTRTLQHG
jgi:hypothetical protein